MESTSKAQKAKPATASQDTAHESISQRVAEELHERIDQAAKTGEKFEHSLYEQGAAAQHKSQEVAGTLTQLAKDNPWAVFGGSVALGFVIGALVSRR